MEWIFAYKAMLFAGFVLCCLIAWHLFVKDDAKPVVDEMTFWKLITIKGAHSGTVFVALAAACFTVMVTTKTTWREQKNGSEEIDLAVMSHEDPNIEADPIDIGQVAVENHELRDHSRREMIMKGGPDDDSAEETTP